MTLYLSLDDVLFLYESLMAAENQPWDRHSLAQDRIQIVEGALARTQSGFSDVEFFPTVPLKAAVMLQSLVRNHPFVDGNKRIGLACMLSFLDVNGWELAIDVSQVHKDEVYGFVLAVATGDLDAVEDVAAAIKRLFGP